MGEGRHKLIGKVLDRKYRLVSLIGVGGMGTVFEAEHVLINRRVAVKVMHEEFVSRPDSVERFFREAKAASAIGHPNIIEIFDVGREDDDTIYIVMELLKGRSLDSLIDEHGRCSPEHSVTVAVQVLSALQAAHEKGIIHRDLKVENVFLAIDKRGREEIKLLDFGIAKIEHGGTSNLGLTKDGNVVGTPYYLAPEQAKGGKRSDHRVDIWGAGVLLYEMLTGAIPFNGENYNEILSAVLLETPRPVDDCVGDLPPGLAAVVDKAMAKEMDDRYGTAGEMMEALLPFQVSGREQMSTIVFETVHGHVSPASITGSSQSNPGFGRSTDERRKSDPAAMTADLAIEGFQYTDSIHAGARKHHSALFLVAGGVGALVIGVILALVFMGGGDLPAPEPVPAEPVIETTAPEAIRIKREEPRDASVEEEREPAATEEVDSNEVEVAPEPTPEKKNDARPKKKRSKKKKDGKATWEGNPFG